MSGRTSISSTATTILTGFLVAVVCAHATAQEIEAESTQELRIEDVRVEDLRDEEMIVTPAEARFVMTLSEPSVSPADAPATDGREPQSSTQLETSPAEMNGSDEDAESLDDVFSARTWMLQDPSVPVPSEERLDWTGAGVARFVASPRDRTRRVTARTSGVFGVEAAQLTPLTGGKEMFSLEVLQGLTLAGVGSRRMWTERDRAFVLAAEAGWQLSPYAGLHVGYEVLQTPLGGAMPEDAGGDSIFARFQLRF